MDLINRIKTLRKSGMLLCLIALAQSVHAQQVVAPLSTPPAVAERQAALAGPNAAPLMFPLPQATSPDLRWGPLNFRPHFAYRYLYGDGIQASPGNAKTTQIHSFSPGLFVELGTHWTIDYTPTWTYYTSKAFRDSVDQTGQINWATKFEEWSLSAGQSYTRTDSPLVETASQTQQTNYASNFNALYAINSRYALETSLSQSLNFANDYGDTRTWSAQEMLHRQLSSRLSTGLGAAYSYTAVNKAPDVAILRFLGNATWRPITQLNFTVQAGIEKTRIHDQTASTKQNPTYSATVLFIPVTTTQLGFTASRASGASILTSQVTETTRYGLTLNQRLLKRLQFTAALDRQESDYLTTQLDGTIGRRDKFNSLNLGLSTAFRSRMRAGIIYQKSSSDSSILDVGFTSEQIGLEFSYNF